MEFFTEWRILLFPALLLLCSLFMWIAGRPKRINWLFGYRMPRATKNQDTWVYANRFFGKLSMVSGFTTLAFPVAIFIQFEHMYYAVPWVMGTQGLLFILTFIFTEIALRIEFDKNGNRRQ